MDSRLGDASRASVAMRLGLARRARGLSQVGMASALGISHQRWSRYEMGHNYPPPDLLLKIWRVTGANADFVLFGRVDGLPLALMAAIEDLNGGRSNDGRARA